MTIYECEHCGHTEEKGGYDDTYFHQTVIPGMTCSDCGKKVGKDYKARVPKYPNRMII